MITSSIIHYVGWQAPRDRPCWNDLVPRSLQRRRRPRYHLRQPILPSGLQVRPDDCADRLLNRVVHRQQIIEIGADVLRIEEGPQSDHDRILGHFHKGASRGK